MTPEWQLLITVIATSLGGIIAGAVAYILDRRKETARSNQLRAVIVTGISDDLNHSLSLYDRLQDEWDKSKTVWFSTVQEFKESRQTYENHRDWILLIDNPELRKKLFKYYLKTNELMNLAKYQQERLYEITRKYNEFIKEIGTTRQPPYSNEEKLEIAKEIMGEEIAEMQRILLELPVLVSKIYGFKSEAQESINDLNNVKIII